MAKSRRGDRQNSSLIWPGFVDAMTALLLVLMFVLSIFMIVQFVLREELTGKDRSLADLNEQVGALNTELSEAEQQAVAFQEEISGLNDLLNTERGERETLANQLSLKTLEGEQLQSELNASLAEIAALSQTLATEAEAKDELTGLLAALTDERDAAQARLADLAGVEEQVATLEQRANRAETELNQLSEDYDRTRAELNDAQTAAEELSLARQQLNETAERLSEAEAEQIKRDATLAALRKKLDEAAAAAETAQATELTMGERVAALELALDQKRAEAEDTLLLLAAAEARKSELETEQASLTAEQRQTLNQLSRREAAALFAQAQLQNQQAVSTQERKAIALLNQQLRELRQQSERATAELAMLRSQLVTTEALSDAKDVEIADLGSRLNRALAEKVGELQQYRSDFFGRMRQILGARDDIRVVGDRFVFESEVLFESASADLNEGGQNQISAIASAIRELTETIPDDVNWILRVDGHTDPIPLSGGGRYANNWELSQARALSVVTFLIESEAIPPNRLAATGFGEHQPIASGRSRAANAQNRRIEFKLTER